MKRLCLAALAAATALCGLSPAFAEPRAYDATTKIRLTCPSTGASAATTAPQGEKGRVTFFASGEYTCLCVGRATCDSTAASGGICLQQGQAIDLRMPGAVPLSCWSHAGLGVVELLSW